MYHTQLSTFLWMGDLEPDMDERFIMNAFAQFGEAVVSATVHKNKTKSSSGAYKKTSKFYCFVEFRDVDTAQNALHKLNGKALPGSSGKRFKLNPASYGREHELLPEFSIYVGDLSSDIDDYELYAFFQKRYKSVRGAKVVQESQGRSKGYGFIRFSEESDQQRALVEMHNMTGLGRRPIKVSLASAKRPSEMPSPKGPPMPPMPPAGGGGYHPGAYHPPYPPWGAPEAAYPYPYSQPHSLPEHMRTIPDPQAAHEVPKPDPAVLLQNDDSEVLEDPCLEINIGKENREFIESSESFFQAIEQSRWQPLNNVMSEIPD